MAHSSDAYDGGMGFAPAMASPGLIPLPMALLLG